MDAKRLIELRKEAERAVAEMPDGDLKLKAFEVILNHLIASASGPTKTASNAPGSAKETTEGSETLAGRLLVLKAEDFFKTQRSLAEIREELQTHGWSYPSTTIAPKLIKLVQKKRLRRQRIKDGNKKTWKYYNP